MLRIFYLNPKCVWTKVITVTLFLMTGFCSQSEPRSQPGGQVCATGSVHESQETAARHAEEPPESAGHQTALHRRQGGTVCKPSYSTTVSTVQ